MTSEQPILFNECPGKNGNLGLITLNRAQVLNALNHQMIIEMHSHLSAWAVDSHIKAVVIQAMPGKAFCAGGDLRAAYEGIKNHDERVLKFFHDEYQLNQQIFYFPKPYIAILDGITMGGGVGISVHGSHRIATEHLLFAMPETGIGFFPDVGGTYFLPRLAHHIGFYLGLSGARLDADDCLSLHLATDKILSKKIPTLLATLAETSLGAHPQKTVSAVLAQFATKPKPSLLLAAADTIEKIFSKASIEEIQSALARSEDPFCQATLVALSKKSPTSLKISLAAMRAGLSKNFEQCMRDEYLLVKAFLQSPDFAEGIRAQLIDKDQRPQWQLVEDSQQTH